MGDLDSIITSIEETTKDMGYGWLVRRSRGAVSEELQLIGITSEPEGYFANITHWDFYRRELAIGNPDCGAYGETPTIALEKSLAKWIAAMNRVYQ